jgi:uncharacterized membrane protein YsdA (DUF1294 family)
MSQRRRSAAPRRPQQINRGSSLRSDRRSLSRYNRRSPYARFGVIAAGFALLLVFILVAVAHMHWYIAWIIGWSIVTFFFYGFDKRRSKGSDERVPEMVLHVLSLIGGFPGGWAGRAYYRHKTLHASFLITLIISTVLHLCIALWLFRIV